MTVHFRGEHVVPKNQTNIPEILVAPTEAHRQYMIGYGYSPDTHCRMARPAGSKASLKWSKSAHPQDEIQHQARVNSCPTAHLFSQDGAPQRTRNATHAMHAGRQGRICQAGEN